MDIENTVSIETANIVNNILKGYADIDLLDIYKRFNLETPKKSIDFYKMCCSFKIKSGKRCSRKRKNGEWCGLHIKNHHKERWCETDYIELEIRNDKSLKYFIDSKGKNYTNNLENPELIVIE